MPHCQTFKKMLIKVKVFPKSREEKVVEKSNDSFEVWVREEPKRGLANKAVIRILASYFGISESKIRLIKGFKKRNKIFKI